MKLNDAQVEDVRNTVGDLLDDLEQWEFTEIRLPGDVLHVSAGAEHAGPGFQVSVHIQTELIGEDAQTARGT